MSKNAIFYFSATGNSYHAARIIASALDQCEMYPIGTKMFKAQQNYERIGFVFPVYGLGLPIIVEKFLKGSDFGGTHSYCFAVATNGGTPGGVLVQTDKLLKKKGMRLSYGAIPRMFANFVTLYKMGDDAAEKANRAEMPLYHAAGEIAKKTDNKVRRFSTLAVSIIHPFIMKYILHKQKKWHVTDVCQSCSKCVNVCPVGNISMNNGRPTFAGKCEQCMSCIQWCPNKAINNGKKTIIRGRYHHPSVTYEDIASTR